MKLCFNYDTNAASGGLTFQSTRKDGVDWPAAVLALEGGGTPAAVSDANPVPVAAAALPLPAGASTLAEQQTQSQLLATMDNDTGSMAASLALIDSAVGEPGENAPTNVMMMGGVKGADVLALQMMDQGDDISDTVDGVIVSAFGYMFDGSNWDRVRGSAVDGLLVNLGTNNDITIGAALPAGSNTIGDVTLSGAALTSLALLDDTIFVDDAAFTPASSKVSAGGCLFDDVAPDSVDEGDIGIARMSANRSQYMQIRDAAGNERGLNINASNQALVLDANSAAALAALQLIDNIVSGSGANISQMNGVAVTMGNGASGTGVQRVTMADNSTGILAGVTTVTTLTGAGIAHDGVDSGNPHKLGAIATASLLGQTPVAAADRTNLYAGTDGALIVREGSSLEDIISECKTNTDGSSTAMTSALAATASQRIYITDIIIANSSAVDLTVDIRDGSGGAVLATFPVPAGGGVVHRFGRPLRLSANTAAAFDGSAAATTLSVTMVGFKSKA